MADRIIKEIETTEVDYKTGEELTSSKTREILHETEPEFIKLYLDCVAGFTKYPSVLNPILLAFLKRMSYAEKGQRIFAPKLIKEEIAEECSVSVSRVDQALRKFVEAEIFFREGSGNQAIYGINAKYFGRGEWKNVKNLRSIQAKFKLTRDGEKAFEAQFEID